MELKENGRQIVREKIKIDFDNWKLSVNMRNDPFCFVPFDL